MLSSQVKFSADRQTDEQYAPDLSMLVHKKQHVNIIIHVF